MRSGSALTLEWVILTMGDRAVELDAAVDSIRRATPGASVTIVWNGSTATPIAGAEHIENALNVGIPAARDMAIRQSAADIVAFLDDDGQVDSIDEDLVDTFSQHPQLAVVTARIRDEHGETSRRHVPWIGMRGHDQARQVATFLGGACAIRRSAYLDVGGYWGGLWYGHEELDLAWRLTEAGWLIAYQPAISICHPKTEIGRHAEGWRLTGRNRVWIARRNLPWAVAAIHTSSWLLIGVYRAPAWQCRRKYVSGWVAGWRGVVEHQPIRWRTVWRLSLLGRPPVV